MRYSFSSLLRLSLAAGALFCTVPAFAQQAAPPANPVATVTVTVGDGNPPVADPGLSVPLVIPAPPGGKLRVEMDARSEDILGVMKSFLKGIGETGERNTPAVPGQPAPPPNSVADLLANGSLADIYKDVNHVHFVVYELAPGTTPDTAILMPGLKRMPPVAGPSTPAFDSNAFYESAFDAEGAHRIMFADAGDYKLVMVGFPDRKGYAFAVSGAGYLAVSRTDGYPNLEILSAFISRATSQVMKSKMVKDAIHKTMNGDKLIGPISGDKVMGEKIIGDKIK